MLAMLEHSHSAEQTKPEKGNPAVAGTTPHSVSQSTALGAAAVLTSSSSPAKPCLPLVVISTLAGLSACDPSSLPPLAFYFLTHTLEVQAHCGGEKAGEEGVAEQSGSHHGGQEGEKRNPGGSRPRDRSKKMSLLSPPSARATSHQHLTMSQSTDPSRY